MGLRLLFAGFFVVILLFLLILGKPLGLEAIVTSPGLHFGWPGVLLRVLSLPGCLVRRRLHQVRLALSLYLRTVLVLDLLVGDERRTLRDIVLLNGVIIIILKEQIADPRPLPVLPLPLVHPLLPLPVILVVHVQRPLSEVVLPSVLILNIFVVYLVLAAKVGEIVVVDVVVEDVRAALLVLVDVVVQVVLGSGDEVADVCGLVLLIDVVFDLRVRN